VPQRVEHEEVVVADAADDDVSRHAVPRVSASGHDEVVLGREPEQLGPLPASQCRNVVRLILAQFIVSAHVRALSDDQRRTEHVAQLKTSPSS